MRTGLRVLRRVRIDTRMVSFFSMVLMLVSLMVVPILTVLHADIAGTMACCCWAAKDHAGSGKPFDGQRHYQQ